MNIKKRIISIGLCLICMLSVAVTGTKTWLGTAKVVNPFSDTRDSDLEDVGELAVGKIVTNKDNSELTIAQKELSFTFAITFSDGQEYSYIIRPAEALGDTLEAAARYTMEETAVEPPEYEVKETTIETAATLEEATGAVLENRSYEEDDIQYLVNGTFVLKHGEVAIFKDLPLGVSYKVVELRSATDEFTVTADNHTGNITRVGNNATFTNIFDSKDGRLVISKAVIGDTTPAPADTIFSFVVNLGEDIERIYPYSLYDTNGVIDTSEITSGELVFLKDGQWIIFHDLPLKTRYQVEEVALAGFNSLISIISGEIIPVGARADFVNAQEPASTEQYGNLILTKVVTTSDDSAVIDTEKIFNFTIRIGENTYNHGLKSGEQAIFEDILVGTPYEIIEDNYYSDGYLTDTNNTNGTIKGGDNHAEVINTLIELPTEELYGRIILEKTVIGRDDDKEFTFHVQIGDGEGQVIRLKNGETYIFPEVSVGTAYRVYEEDYFNDNYFTSSINSSGSITSDDKIVLYTNTYQEAEASLGRLEVSKMVSDADENIADEVNVYEVNDDEAGNTKVNGEETSDAEFNDTKPDNAQGFIFKISFSDGVNYPFELIDSSGSILGTHVPDNGHFVLKHGERALFKDIPSGTKYEVVEEAKAGYSQGLISQAGVITKDELIKAQYHNYKLANTPDDGLLVVKKITTGDNADLAKGFNFTLSTSEQTYEFCLSDGEEKAFVLPIGIDYEISEEDYRDDGYILRGIVHGSGTLISEKTEVIVTNEYIDTEEIIITNTPTPEKEPVSPPISKEPIISPSPVGTDAPSEEGPSITNSETPRTGDVTSITTWLIIIIVSAVILRIMLIRSKRKRERKFKDS